MKKFKPTFLLTIIVMLTITSFVIIPKVALGADAPTLPNPISGETNEKINVISIMLRVMQIALAMVDIFALFMFILGGFEFLISSGNPEKVKKAKDTLVWATIGILVITLSYSVLKFVFEEVAQGFVTTT